MALDSKVIEAIGEAVSEAAQDPILAKRLSSWLDELAEGKTHIENADDTPHRLEEVLAAVHLDEGEAL
jgi:hypothetical protein